MSITIQGCTITPDIVTVPKAEWDKITRIVEAAEIMYEAIQPVWWGNGSLREEKQLEQALADYANAKGE